MGSVTMGGQTSVLVTKHQYQLEDWECYSAGVSFDAEFVSVAAGLSVTYQHWKYNTYQSEFIGYTLTDMTNTITYTVLTFTVTSLIPSCTLQSLVAPAQLNYYYYFKIGDPVRIQYNLFYYCRISDTPAPITTIGKETSLTTMPSLVTIDSTFQLLRGTTLEIGTFNIVFQTVYTDTGLGQTFTTSSVITL